MMHTEFFKHHAKLINICKRRLKISLENLLRKMNENLLPSPSETYSVQGSLSVPPGLDKYNRFGEFFCLFQVVGADFYVMF